MDLGRHGILARDFTAWSFVSRGGAGGQMSCGGRAFLRTNERCRPMVPGMVFLAGFQVVYAYDRRDVYRYAMYDVAILFVFRTIQGHSGVTPWCAGTTETRPARTR